MSDATTRTDEAWTNAYISEFVRYALTRNWTRENAAVWAEEIAGEALSFGGTDPEEQARIDVVQCEWETENAV